jgi:hypothetical protein
MRQHIQRVDWLVIVVPFGVDFEVERDVFRWFPFQSTENIEVLDDHVLIG